MKKLILSILLIVGCVYADVISVTGFRNNTSNSDVDWIGESIADNITSDLVKVSSLNIVNRKELKKILQEQKFQHSGLVDLEKSVEIGEMAGATKLIAGDYSVLNGELRINVNFIDVESGITEKSISKSGQLKDLFYIQNLLVLDLLKALNFDANEIEEMKISQLETSNMEAIEYNYKGVLAVDNQKIIEAIKYFEKAVIIDPNYKNADKNLKYAQKIKVEGKSLFQAIVKQKDIAKQQNKSLKEILNKFKKVDFIILSIDTYEISNVEGRSALLTIKVRVDYNEDAYRDLNEQLISIAVDKSYFSNLEVVENINKVMIPREIIEKYNLKSTGGDKMYPFAGGLVIAQGSSFNRFFLRRDVPPSYGWGRKWAEDYFKIVKTLKIKSSKKTIKSEKLIYSMNNEGEFLETNIGYGSYLYRSRNKVPNHLITTLQFRLSLKKIDKITSIEIE